MLIEHCSRDGGRSIKETRKESLERKQLTISPSSLTPSDGPNTRSPSGVSCTRVGPTSQQLFGTHEPPSARARIWCPKQMPARGVSATAGMITSYNRETHRQSAVLELQQRRAQGRRRDRRSMVCRRTLTRLEIIDALSVRTRQGPESGSSTARLAAPYRSLAP